MPPLVKFYALQPSEFWRLESEELVALEEWMQRYQKEEQEAMR